MPSSVTVTAKTGPGVQDTAVVLSDVTNVNFDMARQVFTVFQTGQVPKDFDLSSVTTLTCTVSGKIFSFTVS